MRNVNFMEVGMKNFGPYVDPMVLSFQNDSLTLITGPNGIGKTMALDALAFTLYGVTSKGARGDDVVNNVVGRNCHTWVKFKIDNDNYSVDRYHKYTKLGNTVTISKNEADPYKKGQKETLPEIERLVCPAKSFMNTLMFGQKVKDFFTDLVDSDKKEIFRKILNLERYTEFYKKASENLKDLEKQLNDLNNKASVNKELIINIEGQLDILQLAKKNFYADKQSALKDIANSIEDTSRLIDQWEKELGEFKEEDYDLSKIEAEIVALENEESKIDERAKSQKSDLDNKKDLKISELQKSAMESKQAIKEKWQEKIEAKREQSANFLGEVEVEYNNLISEKSKIDLEIQNHESSIAHSEKEKLEYSDGLKESFCPTCLQEIDEDCKKKLNEKVNSINNEISQHNQAKTNLLKNRDEIYKKIEELNKRKSDIQRVLKEDEIDNKIFIQNESEEVDKRLSETLQKVQALYESHVEEIKSKDRKLLEDIDSKKYSLAKKLQEQEKVAKKIAEIKETIESLKRSKTQSEINFKSKESEEYDESQLNSYLAKQRDLEIEKKDIIIASKVVSNEIEVISFWKSAFSSTGIPSMLIDESVPFMNQQVAHYLDKLTNGRYVVSFDTLAETKGGDFRDKISVNVLDTHTRASSRIQLSGGQTRIIDIATILTLGDLQSNIQDVNFNILLFDEIFDSLDEENIGFVSKVLSNMKIGKSIYLISHRHEDQLEADEVLVLN